MSDYFKGIPAIAYEGPESDNDFAYRHYSADEMVGGKRMEDQLRFAATRSGGRPSSGRGSGIRWRWRG